MRFFHWNEEWGSDSRHMLFLKICPRSIFSAYWLICHFAFCPPQVENLVAIELAYINTKHPDFHEAQLAHRALTDNMQLMRSHQPPQQQPQGNMKMPPQDEKVSVFRCEMWGGSAG